MLHYKFITGIPTVDITPETMLARCLLGDYIALSFVEDNEPKGIVFFKGTGDSAFIVGIHLQDKTKLFYNLFYEQLKNSGYKYLKAVSKLPTEKFEGFSGFKKLWSVYGKEL